LGELVVERQGRVIRSIVAWRKRNRWLDGRTIVSVGAFCSRSDSQRCIDADTDAERDADTNADADTDAHTECDTNRDADSDTDADAHTDA